MLAASLAPVDDGGIVCRCRDDMSVWLCVYVCGRIQAGRQQHRAGWSGSTGHIAGQSHVAAESVVRSEWWDGAGVVWWMMYLACSDSHGQRRGSRAASRSAQHYVM
jgi:hypothetical protein